MKPKYKQISIRFACELPSFSSDDCKACVYGHGYHQVDGECVRRSEDPSEAKFEAPREVRR